MRNIFRVILLSLIILSLMGSVGCGKEVSLPGIAGGAVGSSGVSGKAGFIFAEMPNGEEISIMVTAMDEPPTDDDLLTFIITTAADDARAQGEEASFEITDASQQAEPHDPTFVVYTNAQSGNKIYAGWYCDLSKELIIASIPGFDPSFINNIECHSGGEEEPEGQTQPPSSIIPDLIVYYPFEDDADDASGYGYHGEIYGATFVEGIKGNGLRFDGVNDYVQTSFSSNRQPLTISVWFKLDDTTDEHSIIDSDMWGNSGQSIILGYWDGDGTLDVQYHNGYYNSSFAIQPGLWYHAVAVFTSGRIELYVNGELAGLDVFTQEALDGDNYRIGRHNSGDPQWFSGVIDEVRIYDRALSAEEVAQLYALEY